MKRQNIRSLALVVVTMAYILLGAAVFKHLEAANEESDWRVLEEERSTIRGKFNLSESAWDEISEHLIRAMPHRAGFQWRFAGAVYFSTTVITTIGYGHSTPKTNWGKIFCMLYALVGIPLNLVMFQSIGERLNTFNTLLICGIKRNIAKHRNKLLNENDACELEDHTSSEEINPDTQRFWLNKQPEDEKNMTDLDKAYYYIQINDSPISADLFEPPKRKVYINLNEKPICEPIMEERNSIQDDTFHEKTPEKSQIYMNMQEPLGGSNMSKKLENQNILKDLETLQRASLDELLSSSFATSKLHLSDTHLICVTTAFSSVFVAGGAYAYSRFEGWTYLDSLYYCIITLTTVGFGDLVALQNNKELQQKPAYVALNVFFILTGLAVVSAAMNLLVLRFLTMNTEDEKRDLIKEKYLHSKEDSFSKDLPANCHKTSLRKQHDHGTKTSLRKKAERVCEVGRHYFRKPLLDTAPPPSRRGDNHSLSPSHRNYFQLPRCTHLHSDNFPNDLGRSLYHSRSRLLTL